MVRVSRALTSLARDPFPFLLTLLGCRFLTQHSWGWLAWFVAAGFCVSVFEQALRADAAPPPRSKDLPRTAYLGCLGGCGLYFAVLLAMVAVSFGLGLTGLQQYNPSAQWTHPVGQTLALICMAWLTQACFCSLCLAVLPVRGYGGPKSPFNGFFFYLGSFLRHPPLNGNGLRLALLLAAVPLGVAAWPCEGNSLVEYSPLLFATLYAHCLGQYVRKGHGFQIS